MRIAAIIIMLWMVAFRCYADKSSIPTMYVKVFGSCVFKMVPSVGKFPAHGVAYKAQEQSDFKELWHVSGWYSHLIYIDSDCNNLVRIEMLPSKNSSYEKDSVIEFYSNGRLIKSYKTNELIAHKENIQKSISHYIWHTLGEDFPKFSPTDDGYYVLEIKTVENVVITFNVSTGEIIEKY